MNMRFGGDSMLNDWGAARLRRPPLRRTAPFGAISRQLRWTGPKPPRCDHRDRL